MIIHHPADAAQIGPCMATIGIFDGVHLGHATLVSALCEQAHERGLKAVVFTFAHHPRMVLSHDPRFKMLQPLDDRLNCLEALGTDAIVVMPFTPELSLLDSRAFMTLLRDTYGMQALMVGYNHHFGHNRDEGFAQYVEHGRDLGIDVVKAPEYLGEYAPVSSSIIRGLINAGKVVDAMHCMGRPYRLEGRVVHGFHNGRGIGFPTANVGDIDSNLILPHTGAYAVMVDVAGQRLQGMVNIGYRPTFDNGRQLSIEVNIFDFDDDIYGQDIALDFMGFLRLEFKMVSIDELRQQLTRDREKARKLLSLHN